MDAAGPPDRAAGHRRIADADDAAPVVDVPAETSAEKPAVDAM